MKIILKVLFFLSIAMSISITLSSSQPPSTKHKDESEPLSFEGGGLKVAETPMSLRGIGHFLSQKGYEKKAEKARINMTCDKNPRICRAKGSPGPDCCKKKCVNVMSDRQNCGICGKKCKYNEMCCGGKCVNTMFDKKNCGGCRNKCKKGTTCVYGMCSYA